MLDITMSKNKVLEGVYTRSGNFFQSIKWIVLEIFVITEKLHL